MSHPKNHHYFHIQPQMLRRLLAGQEVEIQNADGTVWHFTIDRLEWGELIEAFQHAVNHALDKGKFDTPKDPQP